MVDGTAEIRSKNPVTLLLTSGFVIFVLRVGLGALFVYSAWDKVQSPARFAVAVRGYDMLPLALTNLFALAVAWGELLAGVMLVLGIFTRKAAGAIFILLLAFTIAIITTQVRGIVVDCGCFSNEGGHKTDYTLAVRNLFLMTAAAMVMLYDRGTLGLSRRFGRR